jgi:hypothetical protein
MKASIATRISAALARTQHPMPVEPIAVSPTDRHYAPSEVAAMWNISVNTVRDLFRNEPGVFVPTRGRGRYVTMRIPHSVLERVYRSRMQ